jgi:hypothetical protein
VNRIIYSPSEEYRKEAEALAIQTSLPILYGENEHTRFLNFDRNIVQVLFIPKEKFLGFPEKVKKMFACPIGYENDWIDLNSDIQCWASMGELKIKATLSFMEPHFIRYIIRFPKDGNWIIEIVKENNVLDSGEIKVVS